MTNHLIQIYLSDLLFCTLEGPGRRQPGRSLGFKIRSKNIGKAVSRYWRGTGVLLSSCFRGVVKFLSKRKLHKEVVKDAIPFRIKVDATCTCERP
ncbi:hypothetical protein K443DRAFT_356622 [Laccaria amethystina LaAM-08-1]|uniref:Uncharacterized protein n=1 Tax=Laccaria amethystina LaAM-08-1 TaxID=1095629 RepID=A0A0C9XEG0_9AGAR|nr:hypothetical protein K443DRAFT_356622 [Laccaria amethystina LaAM-08-1]